MPGTKSDKKDDDSVQTRTPNTSRDLSIPNPIRNTLIIK